MKVVFLSSPEFGIPSLKALLESEHDVVAVVTQPDAETGRGHKLASCPVAEFAKDCKLKLLQFEKISRDGVSVLKDLKPDIMVTCAYGQILSQEIINIPKFGIINVHGSLLPKYRGASPVQTAVISGDKVTGITIMQTETGLDTGDILNFKEVEIGEDETSGELMERLSKVGAELLLETMKQIEEGTVKRIKQPYSSATLTTKLSKANCTINFNKPAKEIKNLVRGTNPDPIARTELNDEQIKIYEVRVASEVDTKNSKPGTVLDCSSSKTGLFVACGIGAIEILKIQFPNSKVLSGKDVLNGRKISVGSRFSSFTDALN